MADVLDLASGVTHSDSILSAGVDAQDPVVLHYEPQGSALDQVPASPYVVHEIYRRVRHCNRRTTMTSWPSCSAGSRTHYELATALPSEFTADFESFLESVDPDDEIAGSSALHGPVGQSDSHAGRHAVVRAGRNVAIDVRELPLHPFLASSGRRSSRTRRGYSGDGDPRCWATTSGRRCSTRATSTRTLTST